MAANEQQHGVSENTFSVFISHCKWDETDQKVSVPWKTGSVEDPVNYQQEGQGEKFMVLNAAIVKMEDPANPCFIPLAQESQSEVVEPKGRKRKRETRRPKYCNGLKSFPKKRMRRVRGTAHVLVQIRNVEWITLHDWVRCSTQVPVIVPPTCLFDKSAGHLKATLEQSAKTLGLSDLGLSAQLRIFIYECDNAKQNVAILKDQALDFLKGDNFQTYFLSFVFWTAFRVLKFLYSVPGSR